MSENIKINTKGKTDVRNEIIDFEAMQDGLHDENDEAWNTLEAFGESDDEESNYQLLTEVSEAATDKIRHFQSQRGRKILQFLRVV